MPPTGPAPASRDVRAILGVQALRAFAYGFASVILGTSLAEGGLSDAEVGLVFTAMLAGNALVSVLVGAVGDRIGRRRLYVALLMLMGLAGGIYAFARSLPVLVAVALSGTLSTDPNESGPITSLEQSMLGSAPASARAGVFGRYNAIAYVTGAVGALAGAVPSLLRNRFPGLPADRRWLLLFPIAGLAAAVLAVRLSPGVDAIRASAGSRLERSRSTIAKLAALFGLDAFAGGFIVSTFIAFWFARRFGTEARRWGWSCSPSGSCRRRPRSSRGCSPVASACSTRWCSPTCRRTSSSP
jgi:MFS family permease